ncbi:hypothetical protein EV182_003725 [Spiromyces aspiralis]|uniref:Uncharacterized protein n=1 Tax=Spiromyces aspiralis TaxID=68401 RepID=A0ACC1HCD5_9FUNG|nr:hypothetical protein EV182_003725 [Spiromyces aspiralis]
MPDDHHQKQQQPRIRSTSLFRLLNPELFIRPNKAVMILGGLAFVGVVGWLAKDEVAYRRSRASAASPRELRSGGGVPAETPSYQERLKALQPQASASQGGDGDV